MTKRSFPRIKARDLDGREVMLPTGLAGEWNVVIIAFRRQQQAMVDSWVPWLRDLAEATPGLGFAEVPAFGTTIRRGVCLLFDEPVTGIDPFGVLLHPGLTLTVAETERFAATVRDYAGLSAPPEAVVPPA